MSHPRKLIRDGLVDDQFRLVQQLGKGGMGTVWSADDLTLGRPVAIKFLSQELLNDEQARMRFAREPRLASKIRSPHVVQVFAQGTTEDDVPYLVMELLDGEDLATHIARQGACSLSEAGLIVEQICRALGRAHREGLVHRDIKPHNIFLTPESDGQVFVKLLDFGIAKDAGSRITGLTLTGEVVGSALYVSPEQLHEAASVGPSTDIWSLGIVIYEMLTGRLPFEGRSLPELFIRVAEGNYIPVTQMEPGLPKALDGFFAQIIRVDPSQRFQTVDELAAAFARIVRANSSGLLLKQDTPRGLPALDVADAVAAAPVASVAPVAAAEDRTTERLPKPWPRALGVAVVIIAIVATAYALRVKRNEPAQLAEPSPPAATVTPPSAAAPVSPPQRQASQRRSKTRSLQLQTTCRPGSRAHHPMPFASRNRSCKRLPARPRALPSNRCRTIMVFSRCLSLVSICVILGSLPEVAAASPSAAERETARSLMDDGDRLVSEGDLKGALSRYESAHAIMHVPTTGLSLARVQAQLGMLVEARGTAMEVINLPAAKSEPRVFTEARRAAGALSTELEPRVPSIKTVVAPAEVVYAVNIDGVALPSEARLVAFRTNPGLHNVRIEASGYASQTRQVTLAEGQVETITVELQPAAAEVAPPPAAVASAAIPSPVVAAPEPEPVDPAAPGRTRGIIGLSVGGALLIAGTVTGVLSLVKTSHEKDTCPGNHCNTSQSGALSSANTLANIANVCVPLGVLGIGYGLYELLTLPSSPSNTARSRRVEVAFTGTGAVVRGAL